MLGFFLEEDAVATATTTPKAIRVTGPGSEGFLPAQSSGAVL